MATFVLIPGAGGDPWEWHLLVPELEALGHDVVAVRLPSGDDRAGWAEYADAVVEAVGGRTKVVLVAQSLAGFTAPLVCARRKVDLLVLLNAMIPKPGETGNDWGSNTRRKEAEQDLLRGDRIAARDRGRRAGGVFPRRTTRRRRGGDDPRAGADDDADGAAVAARRVARRPDAGPRGTRRQAPPGRVPAAGRAGSSGDRGRRDRRRAHGHAQPSAELAERLEAFRAEQARRTEGRDPATPAGPMPAATVVLLRPGPDRPECS